MLIRPLSHIFSWTPSVIFRLTCLDKSELIMVELASISSKSSVYKNTSLIYSSFIYSVDPPPLS